MVSFDYDLPCSSDTVFLLFSNFEHQNLGWVQEDKADEVAESIYRFVSSLPKTTKQVEEEPIPEHVQKMFDEAKGSDHHHHHHHGGHGHDHHDGHGHVHAPGYVDAYGLGQGWGSWSLTLSLSLSTYVCCIRLFFWPMKLNISMGFSYRILKSCNVVVSLMKGMLNMFFVMQRRACIKVLSFCLV